jgi:hypothetical protein
MLHEDCWQQRKAWPALCPLSPYSDSVLVGMFVLIVSLQYVLGGRPLANSASQLVIEPDMKRVASLK